MYDHVMSVVDWTTMAHHVYDLAYCKVVIIANSDMQFEDTKVQQIMWTKLNETMLKHGFLKSNFKGFMINSAHANYNVIKIAYGFRDPSIRMVDKKRTYYSIGLSHSIGTQIF